ncbi:MAG: proline racemase family protein [Acidimicrobiia bacterium]|nr:proline racemase family protein [Acidimicrobiia bacterium]
MPLEITTTEMHTGGEPVRIIESGYPALTGATILAKREEARARHDHIRTFLMHEPRGHRDMYGVIFVEPDLAEADLAVLFIHNAGYSTMCGHAITALGRYAVDRGLVPRVEPVTTVRIQAPCGLVVATVQVDGGASGRVGFTSVGAFVERTAATAVLDSWGEVTFDVAYGGAFYALLPAAQFGLHLGAPVARLVAAATALTDHLRSGPEPRHPTEPGLSGVYGTILTDGGIGRAEPSRNVCVFADAQVDRSPTGSGVTARMALLHAAGVVKPGEPHQFESLTGNVMQGSIAEKVAVGARPGVTVEVHGRAHYTGSATFRLETDDPLKHGFLLR